MKTNAYGSDFGYNKKRVDIRLNDKYGVKSIIEVINLICAGDTIIRTSLNPHSYGNTFCQAIEAIGIKDIRFGSMGYVLYKD